MKKAFTMAEVLITIGIIGIVVAMTLPALVSNYERKRNSVVLRRAYRDLANLALMYAAENGCISKLSECSMPASDFSTSFAKFLVEKQNFKDLHHCTSEQNWQISFFKNSQKEVSRTEYYGCTTIAASIHNYYLQASNGVYGLLIVPFPHDMYYKTKDNDYFRLKVTIFTDNGKMGYITRWGEDSDKSTIKYPQEGRNMFTVFVMDSKRILPQGASECDMGDSWAYYCKPLKAENCSYETGDFTACMMQVINDGGEIKYRY